MSTHFDGETYDPDQDFKRLTAQFIRVFQAMGNGNWWTLSDLEKATGDPQASVSARIRDFRKEKFGGHTVERRRASAGQHEYRLILKSCDSLSSATAT